MGIKKGLFLGMVHHVSQSCLIPDSQSYHDDGGKQGCKGKPGDGMLSEWQDDDGCKQRSYCRSSPLPPTWKMDCARLFLPPDAIWATLDAVG